jgi:hypothetical protein
MRTPDELTPDELATLRDLYQVYPGEILMRHERDHAWFDGLVDGGYLERTEYDAGISYRMAPQHAEDVTKVVQSLGAKAAMN